MDATSIQAIVEAGAAAVSAGAVNAGVASFETAVRLADQADAPSLRVETRLVLAEALIHTLGGLDEEGVATLIEAERIALANGDPEAAASARAELGYVDFLRARYDRAERWFGQVLEQGAELAVHPRQGDDLPGLRRQRPRRLPARDVAAGRGDGSLPHSARAAPGGLRPVDARVGSACSAARSTRPPTSWAPPWSWAERDHWLSFLPWPQAFLGQVRLDQGDVAGAATTLEQSFARACQIGDPCWEGISARGLALVAEAAGEIDRAFTALLDARARTHSAGRLLRVARRPHPRRAVRVGSTPRAPGTPGWVAEMRDRASRTGMRELTVRALLHGAALGDAGTQRWPVSWPPTSTIQCFPRSSPRSPNRDSREWSRSCAGRVGLIADGCDVVTVQRAQGTKDEQHGGHVPQAVAVRVPTRVGAG